MNISRLNSITLLNINIDMNFYYIYINEIIFKKYKNFKYNC